MYCLIYESLSVLALSTIVDSKESSWISSYSSDLVNKLYLFWTSSSSHVDYE